MMLIRVIIFLVLAGLVIYLYRKLVSPPQRPESKPNSSTAAMKKCDYCGVHLPEPEAVRYQQYFFCSQDHKQRFVEQQDNDPS